MGSQGEILLFSELKVQMDQLDAGSTEVGGFLNGHLSLSWQRL